MFSLYWRRALIIDLIMCGRVFFRMVFFLAVHPAHGKAGLHQASLPALSLYL